MFDLKLKTLAGVAILATSLGVSGCETTNGGDQAVSKGLMGAALGAAAGAIIGNNAGDGDAQSGALIGAVIGGAGGAYAGCREDGGCGAQPRDPYQIRDYPREGQSRRVEHAINKRQYFDQRTGRYYYYDPETRQEYYENGERKYK